MDNPEDNIAIRLKFLIQKLGITNSVFADNCGISRATLSQLLTGRNKKISDVIIGQIHTAYPALSVMWLLFNEGSMWIGDPGNIVQGKDVVGSETGDGNEWNMNTSDEFGDFEPADFDFVEKNPSENLNFPTSGKTLDKESKENGLNEALNGGQTKRNEDFRSKIINKELRDEIENRKSKCRKVVQITIYYDDSTFESFFPRG